MTYRKADSIELHEAGLAFATEAAAYIDKVLPGRREDPTRPVFKIPLMDLMKIGEAFDLNLVRHDEYTHTHFQTNTGATDQTRETSLVSATRDTKDLNVVQFDDYEINILRYYEDYGGNNENIKITSLEAEIPAPNLINIKIEMMWDGEEEPDIREISYSGTFTVWWSL